MGGATTWWEYGTTITRPGAFLFRAPQHYRDNVLHLVNRWLATGATPGRAQASCAIIEGGAAGPDGSSHA